MLKDFSPLIAFTLGWLSAQAIKMALVMKRTKEQRLKKALATWRKSGGMPSGHAASMVALTVVIGAQTGIKTPLFMLAVAITMIVLYDAMNVRYAVGENAKILAKMAQKEAPKVVEGHTLMEVIAGAALGLAIGFLLVCVR